MGCLTALI
jgi:hypothetical protein